MSFKKSIFSYIIWVAYAFLCGRAVLTVLETAEVTDILGWPYAAVAGGVCCYLLLTAGVFFALRILCREIGEHITDRRRFERIWSVVLPVVILIGVVVYLVLYILYNTPLTLEDDSFYRQAVVSAGKSVPFAVHGASWLYPWLLHAILLIFGNTPFVGVVLQIILFFTCLLFVYIGMRAFGGVFSAAVSMAAIAFLPVSLRFVFSLTPELFYLALYLSGFFLIGMIFRKIREKNSISPAGYLLVFVLGIYIGFLIYLDLYSVSLYFVFTALYFVDKGKIKQTFCVNLAMIVGSAAGIVLMVFAASRIGRLEIPAYFKEILVFYTQNMKFDAELIGNAMLLPDETAVSSLLLITTAFFAVPAFLIWKENRCGAFILNLFLVYLLSAFSVFKWNAQMIAALSWGLLSGLGFSGVIYQSGAVEEAEEESAAREGAEETPEKASKKRAEGVSEKASKKRSVKAPDKVSEKEIQNKSLENSMRTATKTAEKNKEQEKPAPGEPLHNPLPMPKKRQRPQVDFVHEVKDSDMKFDIEVADDDDFDV